MGRSHAGTNTVSRAERCPHPPPSLPLYTKSSWLKPAGLRLDWLKIQINHPYWLGFYPQENKISTLAARCPDTERTRIGRWPAEISPGRLRCPGFPVPLSAEIATTGATREILEPAGVGGEPVAEKSWKGHGTTLHFLSLYLGACFSFFNHMVQFGSHFRPTSQQASLQVFLTLWKNTSS